MWNLGNVKNDKQIETTEKSKLFGELFIIHLKKM